MLILRMCIRNRVIRSVYLYLIMDFVEFLYEFNIKLINLYKIIWIYVVSLVFSD